MKGIFTACIIWLTILQLSAQTPGLSNWRVKTVIAEKDTLQLDTLPIIPASLQFTDESGKKFFSDTVDIVYSKVVIPRILFQRIAGQKIVVRYRVFPIDFQQPVSRLDTALISKVYKGGYIGVDFSPEKDTRSIQTLMNNRGLKYSGSFVRGLSFGNSQNLILNSRFNLQLAGKLGSDTEIVAALTDENIPLQAEGDTRQLQEFDKVYIQISRKNSNLTVGDYEISSRQHYFTKYYKKLQGATFNHQTELPDKGQLSTSASLAVSRGRFSRNNITPQEGNQGPYRLEGAEGEAFIIVLAGTERVFLDGQLLLRGIEEDYIIDYNRGELVFTNKRLITQNSRIIAEFEYLDQTFQKSLYTLQSEYQTTKSRFYFSLFAQQDSKRAVGDTELSQEEVETLRLVGDALDNAFISSMDTLDEPFNESRVQYELRDTFYALFNEQTNVADTVKTRVLVFSKNARLAKYRAGFSNVGIGNGNYQLLRVSTANGRVYQWVAPDRLTGTPQGDFEPIKRLKAPEQHQLYSMGAELKAGRNAHWKTELALSRTDRNRFSDKDDADNTGMAFFTDYNWKKKWESSGWEWRSNLKYEMVQQNFRALNPYRSAEFNRDWNVAVLEDLSSVAEHIGRGIIQLNKGLELNLQYELSAYSREKGYRGVKQDWDLQYHKSGYKFRLYGSSLDTETNLNRSNFSRPRFDISKTFKNTGNWTVGIYGEREKNQITNLTTDTLSAAGFYWDLFKVYLQKPLENNWNWNVNYTRRYDYTPQHTDFFLATLANEFNVSGLWKPFRTSQFKWNFTYRDLALKDPRLTAQQARETYLGRFDYFLNLWKGAIRLTTNYEIGSGQEARVEFQFIKVNKGEGVFVWEPTDQYDLNRDSIPQINEFVIAPFRDQANYVRINTFTNDFIRTNNVGLNQSLRLTPRAIWHNKEGWKKLLSKFSTQSILRIDRKVKLDETVSAWNPFALEVNDTSLVSLITNFRNVLFFNRNHRVFDSQLGYQVSQNRQILTTGFESRQLLEHFFRSRWNINSRFSQQLNLNWGKKEADSELFSNRDYRIKFIKFIPNLNYMPVDKIETRFSYEFQKAENQLKESPAIARFHKLKMEVEYNRTRQLAFSGTFSFVKVDLKEKINPTLELTLLEGLRTGRNFLWGMTLNRQLDNNVQLSLRYEGRKTGTHSVIHLGTAQVSATF